MLADNILHFVEHRARLLGLAGLEAEDVVPQYRPFAADLKRAVRFAFDAEALKAAHRVSIGNHTTLVRALGDVRLPAPLVWIEWPEKVRDDLRRLDPESYYLKPDTYVPQRIGLLYEETPEGFILRIAYGDETEASVSFGHLRFDRERHLVEVTEEEARKALKSADIAYIGGLREIDSFVELARHFRYEVPDHVVAGLVKGAKAGLVSTERLMELRRNDENDLGPEAPLSLALILLLIARNGPELVEADLDRLNKRRLKDGKPPLLSYKEAKLRLGKARRRRDMEAEASGATRIQHWQNGHFKRRKTGLFFWHGHLRGDPAKGTKPARYIVST